MAREFRKNDKEGYIRLWGENDMITAEDEIICRRKGLNTT